jgi:hypothetical protein
VHFLIRLLVFLLLICKSSLYRSVSDASLGNSPPSDEAFTNISLVFGWPSSLRECLLVLIQFKDHCMSHITSLLADPNKVYKNHLFYKHLFWIVAHVARQQLEPE